MSYHIRPSNALPCWGAKYQDGDKECGQCRDKESCRPAMLDRILNPSEQRTNLPVLRHYSPSATPPPPPPPPPTFQTSTSMAMVPLPSKPYYPPPVNSLPVPARTVALPNPQPSPPQVQQTQAPQYYQQSTGWSLPSHSNPNPLAPMYRPGAPQPAYYFTQYPGESVATRVGKNMVLRMMEAVFGELMQFFRHWTWPPK